MDDQPASSLAVNEQNQPPYEMEPDSKFANPNFYETDSIKKMPDWIRCGCGDAPYYCEEKNATFGGRDGVTPQQMPDLS